MREMSGDQIRVMTNAVQVFEAWREVDRTFRHSYKGRLSWRGRQRGYLYRSVGNVHKLVGPRSPETEKLQADYTAQRTRLRERRKALQQQLDKLAPINRAYRLGRVPRVAADILRALDAEGLLGEHLLVIGTHSLFAYEAAAGVFFDDDLIATTDVDLLWDARRKLKLALLDGEAEWKGVLGILRKVDRTFERSRDGFRAANDAGYLVDLVRPLAADERRCNLTGPGGETDLEAAAITGLQWLINAPRFTQVAIGEDGRPVRIACIDPRVFALYKRWMATEAPEREPIKRRRDREQAVAVAKLAKERLGLPFKAKDLSALPLRLVRHAKELAQPVRRER